MSLAQHHEQEEAGSGRRRLRQRGRDVVMMLRGRIGPIVRFALAFELLRFLIFAPLGAGVLRLALERWGRCSVGNFEIVAFLLSAPGVLALIAAGVIGVATFYLEIAGLMLLLADRRASAWGIWSVLGRRLPILVGLGLRQVVLLLALAAPFLGAIGAGLKVLWAGHDLNGLLVLKPPVFWTGVALGAGLAATYVLIGGYLVLRWLPALPIALFEPGTRGRPALGLSIRRTRGRLASMLGFVIAWLVVVVVVSSLLTGGLRFGSVWLLNRVGPSLLLALPVTAGVIVVHTLMAALLSVVASTSLAALLVVLYQEAAGQPLSHVESALAETAIPTQPRNRWRIAGLGAALIVAVALVCYGQLARVQLHEQLAITAHRGGAALAPENTVAAIHRAIEAQADWAEIDVQRTADGALVVIHDADLLRVGGLPRRVADSTLIEIQSVDVGSRFGEEFRGERAPTLDELISAAGDRIRLNIELKPNGPDDVAPLVHAVLDALRRAGITGRCHLCSQSYESLQLVRRLEPELRLGFIAGAQLGDLSKLEVNFLMVAERLATRSLAEAAGARGIEVHAWTVNDPEALARLLDRGVANVITDDPAAMRHRLEEIQQLSPAERLLLRTRNWLAD